MSETVNAEETMAAVLRGVSSELENQAAEVVEAEAARLLAEMLPDKVRGQLETWLVDAAGEALAKGLSSTDLAGLVANRLSAEISRQLEDSRG